MRTIGGASLSKQHQRKVLASFLNLILSLSNYLNRFRSLFLGATSRQENGVVDGREVPHEWHFLEVDIKRQSILNILRQIHRVMPADVVTNDSARFNAVIVVFFVIRAQILTIIKVNFLVLAVDTSDHHPHFGRVSVQPTDHLFPAALLKRPLVEVVTDGQQPIVLQNRIRHQHRNMLYLLCLNQQKQAHYVQEYKAEWHGE